VDALEGIDKSYTRPTIEAASNIIVKLEPTAESYECEEV
jgi:hypothetical protein